MITVIQRGGRHRNFATKMGPYVAIRLAFDVLATIDLEDWHRVSQIKWSAIYRGACTYARGYIKESKKGVYLHRFIKECCFGDGKKVDHRNGFGLDNRRSNLRFCTAAQSMWNHPGESDRVGKYKGVRKVKGYDKWYAMICRHGVSKYLGSFDSEEKAALAYNEAALKLDGEFAKPNQII